jgi:hypothetical protein
MLEHKFGTAECAVCNRPFIKKHPQHKYCHWQCQSARNKGKEFLRRQEVQARPDGHILPCEETLSHDVEITRREIPRGRYVYAWFNDESDLPFYIGKGVDDRAWRRHVHKDSGRSQLCQQVRADSSGFRVEIVRDNLTNEGALLLESSLIAFAASCGAVLANQVDPLCRKERPPLELYVSTPPS